MMMELQGDLPVTLVVKAANQRVADQTVECVLGWTVRKLKQHLESVYPSKPKHHQQKIIYSGKLLADHLTLKEVLKQYGDEPLQHTVHLVCSPSVDNMAQAGTSSGSTEKKTEPSGSQTSVDSDGLRHRGSRSTVAAASPSDASNAGINPAMPVPAGADMAAMPGYPGFQFQAMPGMPMMDAMAPGMGMGMGGYPGYQYTPEQMAWMQQMYSQYMAQYMQYYGYQMPNQGAAAAPPGVLPPQMPQQQAANQAAPNNQNPANQNMRMNAQGGLEEDEDEEQRDWLDYIYVFFRFLVLMSIIYFYSSAQRFFAVALIAVAMYLLQNGWMIMNQRQQIQQLQQRQQQQQQQQQQQPQQQPPPQQAQPQQAQPQPDDDVAQNDRQGDEAAGGEAAAEAGEEPTEAVQQPQPVPPPADNPSAATVLARMFVTFFTSLVPSPPPAVNRN